jgi:Raf kinase inhibitor-like YbhB/YbcL family protein
MKLTSTSYFTNLNIPTKYCSRNIHTGQNISPQYSWTDYPGSVKSFVLMMVDRHPKANGFIHWLLADIPAGINKIAEGASLSSKMPPEIPELMNSFGLRGYGGPEPPKGSGRHFYDTTVYALDIEKTDLKGQVNEKQFLSKYKGNILSQATMTGYFEN